MVAADIRSIHHRDTENIEIKTKISQISSLCSLCLCGQPNTGFIHHRDTEDTERNKSEVQNSSLCSLCLCGQKNRVFIPAELLTGEVDR